MLLRVTANLEALPFFVFLACTYLITSYSASQPSHFSDNHRGKKQSEWDFKILNPCAIEISFPQIKCLILELATLGK
jgi:hypothetical protein